MKKVFKLFILANVFLLMAVFLSANSFASATTGTENFFHYGFYV